MDKVRLCEETECNDVGANTASVFLYISVVRVIPISDLHEPLHMPSHCSNISPFTRILPECSRGS